MYRVTWYPVVGDSRYPVEFVEVYTSWLGHHGIKKDESYYFVDVMTKKLAIAKLITTFENSLEISYKLILVVFH